MFCARCLVRSLPTHLRPSHTRLLTTHPAVTSTSAAQPFSTPLTPSPASLGISSSEESTLQNQQEHVDENIGRRRKKSSVKAGMPLRGLEFVKGKDPPLAREDEEYPEWLWGLLEEKKKKGGNEDDKGEGDVFSKSKKQRRVAAKKARKAALLNPASLHPTIPVQHQTIDLPHGDGSGGPADENAQVARETLTAEMRIARRKGIKEGNFLKGMA